MDHFRDLLTGAHHGDEHFRASPLSENIPVTMALLTAWYSGFFHSSSQAILPYSQNLELFPAYLQQLSMESLGKSVDLQGQPTSVDTGTIIWGAPGTDGQHSFHQLLHQGTRLVPADFIAIASTPIKGCEAQQAQLLANCFSQSQALMDGKSREQAMNELVEAGLSASDARELAAHKAIPGNRPSSTLLMHKLDPHNLGYLASIYEHAVYVQSAIWNINAFDQWGVELGKMLSPTLFESLTSSDATSDFDSSTNNLVAICKAWQNS
jgi:glucose-6-phosphate isomerase